MQKELSNRNHTVFLDNRERAVFGGVMDLEAFSDEEICMVTVAGRLILTGRQLHIAKLSLEEGQLVVNGIFEAVEYEEAETASGGLFSRLFK